MIRRMQQRRSSDWAAAINDVLLEGEIGLSLDANDRTIGIKVGDGVSGWGALPWFDPAPFTDATGTVDAITATFDPVLVLYDGLEVRVRALGANTITAPTFNPNGLGAATITKFGAQPLAAGDIARAGHEITLRYSEGSPERWELLNPAAAGDIAGSIHAAASKTTPVNADEIPLADSAASWALKKLTWSNLKATLKTYFDGLYPSGSGTSTGTNTGDQTSVSGNAGTATTLQNARNIDGVSFNGSADITVIAPATHAATNKATPVDADEMPLADSAASYVLKHLTWANIKATLKSYFDGIYATTGGSGTAQGLASPEYYFRDDFDGGVTTSANTGTTFVTTSAPVSYSNSGSSAFVVAAAGRPGIYELSTAASTTGGPRLFPTGRPMILLGGGQIVFETSINIATLSVLAQRFDVTIGFLNAITGTTRKLAASYSDNVNSGFWRLSAQDAGGTTNVDTATVGPAAGVWTKVKIVVNAAGTSAELFIDGVSVATISGNIPTADDLGPAVFITKSAGNTARTVDVDYVELRQVFTTPR